jgi:hypothetical protein
LGHPFDQGNEVTELTPIQAELCERSETDCSDLRALFINCTLKRSPEVSNTQGLMDISIEIMRRNGVEVDSIRAIDHEIATSAPPGRPAAASTFRTRSTAEGSIGPACYRYSGVSNRSCLSLTLDTSRK